MTYYAQIQNDKIVGYGQCRLINGENIEVSKEVYNNAIEHPNMYVYDNGEIILNPNYEQEQAEKERERINNLTVTKRVFALALQGAGITYNMLKTLIASNEQAQLEWDLCVELQRANPLLDQMCSQLSITPTVLDYIFQKANGEDVPYPVEPEEENGSKSEEDKRHEEKEQALRNLESMN